MRKIDRFLYNFFDFKIYTLEIDKSFFKYENLEKNINNSTKNIELPYEINRLKEMKNIIKYIPKSIESTPDIFLKREETIIFNNLNKEIEFFKFTFLAKNELDKLLKEE